MLDKTLSVERGEAVLVVMGGYVEEFPLREGEVMVEGRGGGEEEDTEKGMAVDVSAGGVRRFATLGAL